MGDSASPRDGSGLSPDAGKANRTDKGNSANTPAATCGLVREAWCGSSIKRGRVGVSVNPSFVTDRRRTASVEDGTLGHNLLQQAGA